MSHPILIETQAKMKKAVDHTLHEFSAIHTGKATPSMVEGVMVDAYGTQMRLRDCAAVTTPDARLIQIQPWDASLTKAIEKAIQVANLGFNPVVDGKIVRVPLPDMSRERRQEFVKTASLRVSGTEVFVVSSGAVGLGMGRLALTRRPSETARKQACAAVGQS